MPSDIHLQPAYLLHSRPFRDTSLLLDFITRDHGRLSAIARGVRRANSSKRGLLQPFTPLQASFSGRRELKTLRDVELLSGAFLLKGMALFSALYVNELMTRLIHGQEADPSLFTLYEDSLRGLYTGREGIEPVLRGFEIALLDALGYGIVFEAEAASGAPIEPGAWYHFQLEDGFHAVMDSAVREPAPGQPHYYFPGADILRMGQGDFSRPDTCRHAKRLLRQVLAAYLGDKPLRSRQLIASTTNHNSVS